MRKTHLKTPSEEHLWKEISYELISYEFMSEESFMEDDDKINKHPMPFRSERIFKGNTLLLICT